MKPDQASENRLHSAGMMQQVSGHQSNIGIMDNIDMDIPMMISSSNQQQMRVPIDSGSSVQNIQPVAVPSTQATHAQIMQSQASSQEEEESSGDDDDDECEGDDGTCLYIVYRILYREFNSSSLIKFKNLKGRGEKNVFPCSV